MHCLLALFGPSKLIPVLTKLPNAIPMGIAAARSFLGAIGVSFLLTLLERSAVLLLPLQSLELLTFPKIGILIPKMGNEKSTSISSALFSGVQQRVLGLLFGQSERSFYANEIEKLRKTGRGSLQRELARLTQSGLIAMTTIGRQKHYQANKASPVFQEIRSIVRKTFGLADVLREAVTVHAARIRFAFIFGSVAKGTDTASSDIDVLVVADDLGYSELYEALANAEQSLGRKVSPTLYSTEAFAKKITNDNSFVTRVLDQNKIFLIGSENDVPLGRPIDPIMDEQSVGGIDQAS